MKRHFTTFAGFLKWIVVIHLLIYPKRTNEGIQNRHRGCEAHCDVIETSYVLVFFLSNVEVYQHEETNSDGDLKRDGDPYQDQYNYWVENAIAIWRLHQARP